MELKLGVSAKQTQNLAITPQMQQALKLLQLSNVELNEHLTEEIEKNPFLELNEKQNKNESDHKDKPKGVKRLNDMANIKINVQEVIKCL